jgi:hypothetical protein
MRMVWPPSVSDTTNSFNALPSIDNLTSVLNWGEPSIGEGHALDQRTHEWESTTGSAHADQGADEGGLEQQVGVSLALFGTSRVQS